MKIGFIGCVRSSYKALEALLQLDDQNIEVVAVITKEKSNINSDFIDLTPLCKKNNIPVHYELTSQKEKSISFFKRYSPDVIYCFGWSYLLKKDMLELAPMGAIGYHPAPLPMARGRHPIIWSLVLGLEQTASTFFKMDEGADSGPILSQVKVDISLEDNAESLYQKLMAVFTEQIIDFTEQLANGTAIFVTQDDSKATYWRKRSRKDGLIDWRMQAVDIFNLIRALTPPYPGAECLFNDQYIIISESNICKNKYSKFIEPGRILDINNDMVLVKCGGSGALWIKSHQLATNLNKGDYL